MQNVLQLKDLAISLPAGRQGSTKLPATIPDSYQDDRKHNPDSYRESFNHRTANFL